MFTTLIVQPIFNLLVLIAAILPGHNFGLAIILFTIVVRLLMWPLVKKQLHHAKAMRQLQPEIKKIKQAAGGNRQAESRLVMELYKERQINPFASIGILIVQVPILIGLYVGLRRIITNPHELVTFSYPALHHLAWVKSLTADIHHFDATLFGQIDLTRPALHKGVVYWPAMIIVAGSAIAQYFQSKQLMPQPKDARGLKSILSEAGQGRSADQQEVNAAVGRATLFLIPGVIFLVSLGLAAAMPLYWLTSATIAIIQQAKILKEDVQEAEVIVSSIESKGSGERKKVKASVRKRKVRRRR